MIFYTYLFSFCIEFVIKIYDYLYYLPKEHFVAIAKSVVRQFHGYFMTMFDETDFLMILYLSIVMQN